MKTVINNAAGLIQFSGPIESAHTGELVELMVTDHRFEVMVNDTQHEAYLRDARKVLDEQSKKLNARGLERLIAALIIEYVGNNYVGKDNQ